MIIETYITVPTILTNIKSECDDQSAENLSDYLSNLMSTFDLKHNKVTVNIDQLGKVVFNIDIDSVFCIDPVDFNATIEIVSDEIDIPYSDNIIDSIIKQLDWQKIVFSAISDYIQEVNSFFVSTMVPKKESFRFENGRYWIEFKPNEPYQPEFMPFQLYDDINEDQFISNIY